MLRKEDFSLPLRHFSERRTKKVKLSVCQNVYNKDIFREKKSTHTSPPPFAIPHSPPPAQFQPISLAPSNFFFQRPKCSFANRKKPSFAIQFEKRECLNTLGGGGRASLGGAEVKVLSRVFSFPSCCGLHVLPNDGEKKRFPTSSRIKKIESRDCLRASSSSSYR